MLGNVYSLVLWGCNNITDIYMLGNVYTLDLWGCDIKDVSMLGNINTLYIVKDKYDITGLENSNIKYYNYNTDTDIV